MAESPRGISFPLRKIVRNRLNPNEMDWDKRITLREDMLKDTYDPIVISPATVFYGEEAAGMEFIVEFPDGVQLTVDPEEAHIICDGQHRYEEALTAGMTEIRALIWRMTEAEAMPWFYKRHRVRGELNPIKEAELFWFERNRRGLSRAEIVKAYGLSSDGYLKTRLKLSNLSQPVADLFYDPPKTSKITLTLADLRELATLPRKLQKVVALIALERNWTTRDITAECRRVKGLKGLRSPQAYVPPPEKTPPERSGMQIHTTPPPEDKPPLKSPEEAAPDEEVFKDYPPDLKEQISEEGDVDTIKDTLSKTDLNAPKVIPTPGSWKKASQEQAPASTSQRAPFIISRGIIEPFINAILSIAADELLNLNSDAIEGRTPMDYLKERFDEDVYQLLDKDNPSVLPRLALRTSQMWVLEVKKDE